jgi:hypothetical protein
MTSAGSVSAANFLTLGEGSPVSDIGPLWAAVGVVAFLTIWIALGRLKLH